MKIRIGLLSGVLLIILLGVVLAATFKMALPALLAQRAAVKPSQVAALPEQRAVSKPAQRKMVLPTPPKQHVAWKPPQTTLPPVLISAITALYAQGLADPRDCDYREITLNTGSAWGNVSDITVHGWVLPGKAPHFAVCWNGLVTPVLGVGKVADLHADINALIANDEKARADFARESPQSTYFHMPRAQPEASSASQTTMLPVKVCLLLRLGEEEAARRFWEAYLVGMPPHTNDNDVVRRDPYVLLATDWAWAQFDRAVTAHMRGDDRLALADSRAVQKIGPLIDAEAVRRKYPQPLNGSGKHIFFLGPLPVLIADSERRLAAPSAPALKTIAVIPQQRRRIAALIQALEQVHARQWGQPGGVNLAEDPVVQALTKEGEAAMEPLLNCLEHDTRLTRSISFGRDFFMQRNLISVAAAANAAICNILQTNNFGALAAGAESRKQHAAEIRAFWAKNKRSSPAERLFRTLADDQATQQQWLEAADTLVRPADVRMSGMWTVTPSRKPSEHPAMRGEPLRQRTNPSVADLLAKRALQLGARGGFPLDDACRIGLDLAKWDRAAAPPTLQTLSQRCREGMKAAHQQGSWTTQILGMYIAQLTTARLQAGDAPAATEYAGWMRTTNPVTAETYARDFLEPLWQCPDNPRLAAAAGWLFNDPASPWSHLDGGAQSNQLSEYLRRTSLLGVLAFRTRLLALLHDTRPAGTVKLRASGQCEITFADTLGGPSISNGLLPGAGAPTPDTVLPFRTCDYVARLLSMIEGLPRCELYWPQTRRDAAIAACAERLQRYGDRYRPSANRQSWEEEPKLSFPHLGHPATPEDVAAGCAIFTLTGQVRTVPLALPLNARWLTQRQYPRESIGIDPKTKQQTRRISYDQTGVIWQAEEVLENGRWVRYYGFVGLYNNTRAPAAEIELVK